MIHALRTLWRIQLFLNGQREHITPPLKVAARGKPNSKNSRVLDRVIAVLQERGPMHRTALLEVLLADGLVGTERKPMNRLASILASNSSLFSSDGRGVYSLVGAERTRRLTGANSPVTPCDRERQRPTAPINPKQKDPGHAAATWQPHNN